MDLAPGQCRGHVGWGLLAAHRGLARRTSEREGDSFAIFRDREIQICGGHKGLLAPDPDPKKTAVEFGGCSAPITFALPLALIRYHSHRSISPTLLLVAGLLKQCTLPPGLFLIPDS